jgi:hypothetical protein
MATVQSAVVAATYPARWRAGELVDVVAEYTFSDTVASGTVIDMVNIPIYANIRDVVVLSDDLDSSTNVTLSVGDTNSANRFIDASTVAQSGGRAEMSLRQMDYRYSANDTIRITTGGGATTSSSGKIQLRVSYFCGDPYYTGL